VNEVDENISRDVSDRLKISVVIASLGRPQNIAALLASLAAQSQLPAQVILSMETTGDTPPDADYPFVVEKIFGLRGSSAQRNRGLDRLNPDIDIVVFYDDDFVPSRFALAGFFRITRRWRALTALCCRTGSVALALRQKMRLLL
jgi:glycosyltransferase involved in cell wall biosynthesis